MDSLASSEQGVTAHMLAVPSVEIAEDMLQEAAQMNPGPWVDHSRFVATAAKRIAERVQGIDPQIAYILGLLHDIGRRSGVFKMRHGLDGYKFAMDRGFSSVARVCLTHTSFVRDGKPVIVGQWDGTDKEYADVMDYLKTIEENEYDRLIKLCDYVSLPNGFCLLEKRMVDMAMRGGVNELTVPRWASTFAIKRDFEARLGCSIYDVLPEVVKNSLY